MAVVIGIDVGTTNWKVAAFTEHGQPLIQHKTPTKTHYMENGCGYYEPKELWETFSELLRKTVADLPGQEILGISVTSMTESVVPIDRAGNELFPIIAWFDGSAKEQARQITERFGEDHIFAVTGLDPDPIFSLPKIMWVRDHYPEVYEKADKWLQMADYIYYKLCGATVTDYTMACRTLAYDLEKRAWSDELMGAFDVPKSVMPDVVASGTYLGGVSVRASEETGLPKGTKVFAGGHDHPCASITSGCMSGQKILDSSGTAEAFLLISDKYAPIPKTRQGQRVGLYLDPSRYVLWGGIKASGASADWGYQHLTTMNDWTDANNPVDYGKVLARLAEVPLGSEGAVFIPHLRGSGAPSWNPADKGSFVGLTSRHTDAHLMRAIFEALSCQAKIIVEMHQRISGMQAESVCVAGGSTKNLFWQQLKADVLGIPVELSPFEDATVHGAALLAAIGAGVYGNIEEASSACAKENRVLYPNASVSDECKRLYERYCIVNDAVCALHRRLDGMN